MVGALHISEEHGEFLRVCFEFECQTFPQFFTIDALDKDFFFGIIVGFRVSLVYVIPI